MKWHFALSQLVAVAATITSAHAEGRHGRAPASAREADAVFLRSVDAVHEYCQVDVATLCTGRRPNNNVPHENPFNGMIDMRRSSFHSRPPPFLLLEPPPSLFATPGNVEIGGSPFDDIDAIMDGMFRQAMEFASPFLEETTRSGHRMGEPVTKITVVRLGGDDDAPRPRPMPLPVPMVTIGPIMPGGDRGPADEVVVDEDPDAAIDRIFDNVIFSFLEDVQRTTGLGGFGPVMGDVKREKHEDTVPEEASMPEKRNDAQITRDEIFGLDDDDDQPEVSKDDVGATDEHDDRSRLGDGDVVQGEKRQEAAVVSAAVMPETDAPIPKEPTSESGGAGEASKEEFVPPKPKWEGFDDDLYDDFYFVFDDDSSSPSSPTKRDEVASEDDEHERQHRHDHEVDPAHLADALSAAGRELLRSSASASTSRDGGMTDNVIAEEDPLRLRFARRLTEVAPSAPAVLRHREPRLHEDVVAPVAQRRSPPGGGPIPVPPRFPDLRYGCPRIERCLWERRHSTLPPGPFSAPLSTKCANALDVVREADVDAREAHVREEAAASTTLRLVLRPPAVGGGGEGRTTWTQLTKDLVANADPCGFHLAALGFFTSLLCVVLLCGCFGSEDEEEEEEDDDDYGEEGDDQVHHGYPGAVAMARRNEAIRREMALRNGGVAPMASETAGAEVFVAVPVAE